MNTIGFSLSALLSPQAATDGYGGGFQGHLQHMKWDFAVINSPQVKEEESIHATQLVWLSSPDWRARCR